MTCMYVQAGKGPSKPGHQRSAARARGRSLSIQGKPQAASRAGTHCPVSHRDRPGHMFSSGVASLFGGNKKARLLPKPTGPFAVGFIDYEWSPPACTEHTRNPPAFALTRLFYPSQPMAEADAQGAGYEDQCGYWIPSPSYLPGMPVGIGDLPGHVSRLRLLSPAPSGPLGAPIQVACGPPEALGGRGRSAAASRSAPQPLSQPLPRHHLFPRAWRLPDDLLHALHRPGLARLRRGCH